MAASNYFDPMFELARRGIQGAQRDIYGFMRNVGQRQGHLGAMQMAAQAVAPFADEIGKAGARAAAEAQQMETQMKLYEQQKEQWEKAFAANEAERERRYQLEQERFNYEKDLWEKEARLKNLNITGYNPIIMQDLGYDTMKYPMNQRGTYAGALNQQMGLGYNYPQQFGGGNNLFSTMKYQPGMVAPSLGGPSGMSSRPMNYLGGSDLQRQMIQLGYK